MQNIENCPKLSVSKDLNTDKDQSDPIEISNAYFKNL
jgi:hypothetical protein